MSNSGAAEVKASELLPQIIERPLLATEEYVAFLRGIIEKDAMLLAAYYVTDPEELTELREGIAIIRVQGRLYKGMYWDDYYDIQNAYDAAMDNPSVRGVLFNIDSPGGSVSGCFELCEHIQSRRDEKPVWAHCSEQATSAAYAIASSASRFEIGRGAIVGSIGVIAMHVDYSEMDKQIGVKVTEIVSGKHKNDLSPYKPLNKDGRATLQKMVDLDFEAFAELVSKGRRALTVDSIRSMEAKIFFGEEAVEQKLADRRATLDETIEKLSQKMSSATTVPVRAGSDNLEAEASTGGEEMAETPTTTDDGNVVGIEEARSQGREQGATEARTAERARTQEITQLCSIAGDISRIAEFLNSEMTVEQVREALVNARASATDRPGTTDAHPGGEAKSFDFNPSAVYERWGRRYSHAEKRANN